VLTVHVNTVLCCELLLILQRPDERDRRELPKRIDIELVHLFVTLLARLTRRRSPTRLM